jgi:hypothetical protein
MLCTHLGSLDNFATKRLVYIYCGDTQGTKVSTEMSLLILPYNILKENKTLVIRSKKSKIDRMLVLF